MRALLISVLLIGSMAGLFVGSVQQNDVISFGVEGVHPFSFPVECHPILVLRYSVLPALCLDGVIWLKIVEGSFTTELFTNFIKGLLMQMNDFPQCKSVIVMDNCRIHKGEHIKSLIETRYSTPTTISTVD